VIRILIADDEPLARRALVRMLRDHDDVKVVAECEEGDTALAAIDQLQPDLVFLDIRMPGLDGLGVASRLFRKFSGSVVFVTAHDSHALEAFDLNALDYLLKPFTSERLAQALARVRERTAHPLSAEALERLMAGIREREAQPRYMERIPANKNGRIHLVGVALIERIDAMGNYALIHTRREHYEIRETLQSLEKKLDPARFVRIHRSMIINLDYVLEVQKWFRGGHQVLMKDGTEVRLSRYQTDAVKKLTGRQRSGL
jgi:two-component system, LytTR family, response regulator